MEVNSLLDRMTDDETKAILLAQIKTLANM